MRGWMQQCYIQSSSKSSTIDNYKEGQIHQQIHKKAIYCQFNNQQKSLFFRFARKAKPIRRASFLVKLKKRNRWVLHKQYCTSAHSPEAL
eukprot:scaffold2282_cov65-Cyclotella_meneghiniana.AAC.5